MTVQFRCLPPWFVQPHPQAFEKRKSLGNQVAMSEMFVGFTLEAKLVSSKRFIPVHLKILSRSVENMASHLLTKFITWSSSCQPSFAIKNHFEGFYPTRNAYVLRFLWVLCSGVKKKHQQQQPIFSRMTQQCTSRQINRRRVWAWPRP